MLLGRGAMQHEQQLLQRKSCIEFPTNSSLKLIVDDAFAATLLISGTCGLLSSLRKWQPSLLTEATVTMISARMPCWLVFATTVLRPRLADGYLSSPVLLSTATVDLCFRFEHRCNYCDGYCPSSANRRISLFSQLILKP